MLFVLGPILIACFICCVRVVIGPTTPDRLLAVDTISLLLVAGMVVLGVHYKTVFYLDVALVYALLSFLGTLAISKYLNKKDVGA